MHQPLSYLFVANISPIRGRKGNEYLENLVVNDDELKQIKVTK